MSTPRAPWLWTEQSPIEHRPAVVTSRWRQDQHLAPRRRSSRCRSEAYFSYWSREDDLFLLYPEYHEDAVNDMESYRAITLQRQPGYFNPYLLVWLTTTADAIFSFLLFALVIRVFQIRSRLRRHRSSSLITAPATMAAVVLCTVPKLALVAWATEFSAPSAHLKQIAWNPLHSLELWLQTVSVLAPFTVLLMLSTLVVLLLAAGSLKRLAVIDPVAQEWRTRINRVALYLLPVAVSVWATLSILNEAPITIIYTLTDRLIWHLCHCYPCVG
jgi:hypothetical protein